VALAGGGDGDGELRGERSSELFDPVIEQHNANSTGSGGQTRNKAHKRENLKRHLLIQSYLILKI
jgi:hypothetical protein